MILHFLLWLALHVRLARAWEDFCGRNPAIPIEQCMAESPRLRNCDPGDWRIDLSRVFSIGDAPMVYCYKTLPKTLGF